MSLVDYASSSDDELPAEEVAEGRGLESQLTVGPQARKPEPEPSPPPIAILPANQMHHVLSSNQPPKVVPPPLIPDKLPDASLLLNSPSISSSASRTDHRSWVGPVKRDSTDLPSSSLRSKLPKVSNLHHTRNVTDTSSGMLVPPQLRGRSNVVTEDMGKLFVKRPAASPSQ